MINLYTAPAANPVKLAIVAALPVPAPPKQLADVIQFGPPVLFKPRLNDALKPPNEQERLSPLPEQVSVAFVI